MSHRDRPAVQSAAAETILPMPTDGRADATLLSDRAVGHAGIHDQSTAIGVARDGAPRSSDHGHEGDLGGPEPTRLPGHRLADPGPDDVDQGTLKTGVARSHPQRIGRFEILAKLGEGGMGEVFRAVDTETGKEVALKRILPTVAGDPDRVRADFRREAGRLQKMRHRNIVQVIYVGEGTPDEGGEPFYVMEYCKGGSLGALEGTKLPAERIIEIGSKIAEALVLIGSRMSVVHRDIKPANILLRDNGEPVLADFGIIHAMVDSSIQRATTAGTPIFMAPEVARGDAGSPQSDIYSLGATLYTLASGMRPYVGESQEQVLNQIRTEAPPALAKLAPELPPDLIRIIEGMMARELRDRYVQARDVIEDFERLKRGEPLLVRGGGFHPQTPASHPKPGPFNEPADPASKSRAGGAEPAAQSRSRPRSHWALALVVGTAFFAATAGTGIWLAVSHAGKPSQPTSPSEEVSPAEDGPAKKADPTASADKSGAPANTPPTPSQSPSKTQQTTGSAGPFGELSAAIKVRDHQRVEALSKTLGGAVCPETEAHPAFVAVEEGELESLKTLLRNKVTDGLAVDGPGKQSLVHRAIDRRQFEVLAWLADPKSAHDFPGLGMLQTCKDANGLNGLHWALSKGDLGSARVLLAAGWDPCNADSGGRTALHWAAEKGDADVLRLIVERGGNGCIAARDLGGATAMDRAMSAKNLAAIGYFKDLLATGSVEVPGWDRAEWMTKAEAAGL